MPLPNFDLTQEQRQGLIKHLSKRLESYYSQTRNLRVSPVLDLDQIRDFVTGSDLKNGMKEPLEAIDHVLQGLEQYAVHTPHPAYYGLFNPRPNFASTLADWMTATFNPQMAAWSHNPFANEVERRLIKEIGNKMGYPPEQIDGNFGAGGAEANLTAVLCALQKAFPGYLSDGLASLDACPTLYCSAEAHHSVHRAARVTGLGASAVRLIPVDENLRLLPGALDARITQDKDLGLTPLMVIATAGTTGSGSIDPIEEMAIIAEKHQLWLHVDAAFGGAARFTKKGMNWLEGIDKSQSITIDIHKWLSVPMGASVFLTREDKVLAKTFGIHADYMPREGEGLEATDPFTHSIQWSRRFIGLKLYLSLLFYGWNGYQDIIENHIFIGAYLKTRLKDTGWHILVDTPLPVVCFVDERNPQDEGLLRTVCQSLLSSGKTWISLYPVNRRWSLRACITNYATSTSDIDDLIELLKEARTTALLTSSTS